MSNIVPIDDGRELTENEKDQVMKNNINDALINIMGVPPSLLQEANMLANKYRIKHGLNASIPMLCKAHACPFYDVCQVAPHLRIAGSRCLQEIAAMVSRFESLCRELNITENDQVDMGLIKDVVDIEIMLLRADNRLAIDGDMVKEYFAVVDQAGRRYTKEEINVVVQAKLSLIDKKTKLLEKLYATRKDKADEIKKKKDQSVKTAGLVAKVRMMTQFSKDQKRIDDEESNKEETIIEMEAIEYELEDDHLDFGLDLDTDFDDDDIEI